MTGRADEGVRVWFLVVREVPIVVVDVADGSGPDALEGMVRFTLESAGFAPVPAFYGHALEQRPPRVAWHLDDELTLADDQGERILRLPADEADPDWRRRAVQVQGSATYVTAGLDVDGRGGDREICDALDARARSGQVIAAIVGVGESSSLPLFGA